LGGGVVGGSGAVAATQVGCELKILFIYLYMYVYMYI
jgi:hypothetical protein